MNYHMTDKQAHQRFNALSVLISKYAHLWPASDRLTGWVHEYNKMIETYPTVFETYCEENDYSPYHNGYDSLA